MLYKNCNDNNLNKLSGKGIMPIGGSKPSNIVGAI
jgi:hypothetical protein